MIRQRFGLAALLSAGILMGAYSLTSAADPTAAPSPAASEAPAATAQAAPAVSPPASPGTVGTTAFIPGQLANPSQTYAWSMVQKDAAEYGFTPIVLDGGADIQVQT